MGHERSRKGGSVRCPVKRGGQLSGGSGSGDSLHHFVARSDRPRLLGTCTLPKGDLQRLAATCKFHLPQRPRLLLPASTDRPTTAQVMGALSPRGPPAASRRSVRLTVLGLLACAIYLSTTATQPRDGQADDGRGGAERQAAADDSSWTAAAAAAGSSGTRRPLYGLPQPEMQAAVVAASERHGPVTKAGPVPQQFWTDERRPWRESVFLEMLKRGAMRLVPWFVCVGGMPCTCLATAAAAAAALLPQAACCAADLARAGHLNWGACPSSACAAHVAWIPLAATAADMVQPRSSEYWAADPATGELALRPLALPYPLCHTCVDASNCSICVGTSTWNS